MSSYTVIAGPGDSKIVQFWEQAALLGMAMLVLARDAHCDVVPSCSEIGWVGDPGGSQLAVTRWTGSPERTMSSRGPPSRTTSS